MVTYSPTRGYGLLERYLSRRRAAHARRAFTSCPRRDALLDLGCGMYSEVLKDASFRERYALDQIAHPALPADVHYYQYDLTVSAHLPFCDAKFDAVTLLAVIEHLPVSRVAELCEEIYRVLNKDGVLFLTTPRSGTDALLHLMARARLVSSEEIAEHVHEYGSDEILSLLIHVGFSPSRIHHGAFEWGLNTWTSAQK